MGFNAQGAAQQGVTDVPSGGTLVVLAYYT
jgi:hypothetical protein